MNIETFVRGKRIGVNRDGKPVGEAHRVNSNGAPERWTAFVYTLAPPYDTTRLGFNSADEVVAFIAKHGQTPPHLA